MYCPISFPVKLLVSPSLLCLLGFLSARPVSWTQPWQFWEGALRYLVTQPEFVCYFPRGLTGVMGFREEGHGGKSSVLIVTHRSHILSTRLITLDIGHLTGRVLIAFTTVKSLFLLFHRPLFARTSLRTATLKGWRRGHLMPLLVWGSAT